MAANESCEVRMEPLGGSLPDPKQAVVEESFSDAVTKEIPDAGVRPWLAILALSCLTLLTGGLSKSFSGVKAAYMATHPEDLNRLALMFVPGVFPLVSLLGSPLAAAAVRLYGATFMLAVGCGCCMGGFLVASFSSKCELLLFSSLIVGSGFSILSNYTVFVIGKLFKTKKPLALALTLSGGCVGHEFLPRLLDTVIDSQGVSAALAVLALLAFFLVLASYILIGNPEDLMLVVPAGPAAPVAETVVAMPEVKGSYLVNFLKRFHEEVGLSLLNQGLFWVVACAAVLFGLGSGGMTSALKSYGGQSAFDNSESLCVLSVVVVRFTFGLYAPHSSTARTLEMTVLMAGSTVCFLAIRYASTNLLLVSAVLGAIFSGSWSALTPALIGNVLGAENIGKGFALVKFFRGLAGLVFLVPKASLRGLLGEAGYFFVDLTFMGSAAVLGSFLYYQVERKEQRSAAQTELPNSVFYLDALP